MKKELSKMWAVLSDAELYKCTGGQRVPMDMVVQWIINRFKR